MCVMSVILDDFGKRNGLTNPPYNPQWIPTVPVAPFPVYPLPMNPPQPMSQPQPSPTRQEHEALKREVEALRELLIAARKFDNETAQRDCEETAKRDMILRLAEMLGVDMTGVFPKAPQWDPNHPATGDEGD